MVPTNKDTNEPGVFDVRRWGLPAQAVATLADRLQDVWSGFRECFATNTRDTGEYAQDYLRGLLTRDSKRNYANSARRGLDPDDDGQNLQQFMSDSPGPARAVFDPMEQAIVQRPARNGGMLALDESGDKRSGDPSAGAARQ